MSKSNKDKSVNKEDNKSSSEEDIKEQKKKEISIEEKLKFQKKNYLRSLADSENQRRRFEKEIKDAYEFGGFSFAKEMLAVLDNLHRAKSMQEDGVLSKSRDFDQFLKKILKSSKKI